MNPNPNYYDIVVSVARMNGDARLPWWKLDRDVSFFEKKFGVSVDRIQLREGWREFTNAIPSKQLSRERRQV